MRTQAGFTLMELLVVIAIASVLTGIAIPSFRSMMQSAQAREAATGFYSGLNRARSESVAHNSFYAICARNLALDVPTCATVSASGNWANGWIVYAASDLAGTPATTPLVPIQIQGPLPNVLELKGVASPLTFDAAGRVGALSRFDLCNPSEHPDVRGRRITVSRSGRVALEQRNCP